mgnify:CR=1 FL=1
MMPPRDSEPVEIEQLARRPRDASGRKIGRNDPCPCGSGVKFKHCHWNRVQELIVTPRPLLEHVSYAP